MVISPTVTPPDFSGYLFDTGILLQKCPDGGEQPLSRLRQADALSASVKEREPHGLLHGGHQLAHAGGGVVQFFCRPGKATGLSRLQKGPAPCGLHIVTFF